MIRRALVWGGGAIALLLAAAPATAILPAGPPVVPSSVPAALDPGRSHALTPAGQARWTGAAAWRAHLAAHPGWSARWDEARGVPLRAEGPGVATGGPFRTADEAASRARTFLAAAATAWVRAGDLKLVDAVDDGAGWWVRFAETHRGVRVVGGRATVRMTADGRVVRFGLDTHPGLDVDVNPPLDDAAVQGFAARGLPVGPSLEHRRSELVILPVNGDYRLAWEVEIAGRDPEGDWVSWVDATTGDLLGRLDNLRHAFEGQATALVEPLQVGDAQQLRPLAGVTVTLRGGGSPVSTTTAANGSYALAPPTTDPDTLDAGLAGPYAAIVNNSAGNETPMFHYPVDPLSPGFSFTFSDPATRVQDRDAFYWVNRSHDRVKAIDPAFTALDYTVPVVTDLFGRECNAYWSGYGLVFYPDGPNCANTARSASVVIHEYGHGITDYQYRPFYPSAAMHEGWSDYFSATVLDDPVIGRGFFGRGSSIRRIDGGLRVPDDINGEPHHDGLILAGALWDVRGALGAALTDHLWHFARYGLSDTYDDYFADLLLTDDDNGNVYDGTPHFAAIVDAFRAHGIGDYSIRVSHAPLLDTEDLAKSLSLTASFLSVYAIDDASVVAHVAFHRGGDTTRVDLAMAPTGGVREYRVVLDPQPADTEIRYWFTAADTVGTTVTWPPHGEGAAFTVRVGADVIPPVIVHEALRDQAVDADAYRILASVTDNLDRGVDSVRVAAAADDETEITGTLAPLDAGEFEGFLPFVGRPLGTAVRYRIVVADSAAVPNTAVFPDTGWSRFTVVRGLERSFDLNDGGLHAAGDWAWGSGAPWIAPWSGTGLWGTNLAGVYGDERESHLILGPVDLSDFTKCGLFFHHAYDIEEGWDGATVYASRDGGIEWEILRPDGGYPFGSVEASGAPAYSGKHFVWTPAAFDLSSFLGEPDVRIRFTLASDQAVAGLGWYLDDVEVVERRVFSRPSALRARSGENGRVPLAWTAPAGLIAGVPGSPLLGYHVYRAEGSAAWTRLTGEPWTGPDYVDATAVNGTTYRYGVSAVYTDGESPLSDAVEALPYLAVFSAPLDTLAARLGGEADTTLVLAVANTGTGVLRVNAWTASEAQTLDDVRARFDPDPFAVAPADTVLHFGPDPALYRVIFDGDPDEGTRPGTADLRRLEAESLDGNLYVRITAHATWGDPLQEFTFAVAMDTDDNLDTGAGSGDAALYAGSSVYSGSGIPALITDASGTVLGFPDYVDMEAGATTAVFGFPLALIGSPDRVLFTVRTLDTQGGVELDRMPDPPAAPWIDLASRHVEAVGEATAPLPVRLASEGLAVGAYRGALLLETNAPADSSVRIPVALTVAADTPVELLDFTATGDDLGVRLRWRILADVAPLGFHVYRADAGGTAEIRLTDALLPGDGRGDFAFEDRAVEEGRAYLYRLAAIERDGAVTAFGPFLARYDGASALAAPVLRPGMPNPAAAATTLRFGLPVDAPVTLVVHDLNGGVVRTLLDGAVLPRGFHERTWDLRDDAGRRVASGIYLARFVSGTTALVGKVAVLP